VNFETASADHRAGGRMAAGERVENGGFTRLGKSDDAESHKLFSYCLSRF
jgi:hypothetical protein